MCAQRRQCMCWALSGPRDGVRYDIDSPEPKSTFAYDGDGWKLTHDDHQFIKRDRIAIIQLNSGQVNGWIDLSELRPRMVPPPQDVEGLGAYGKAVANGIAYDAARRRLFVTGKNWLRLFEIRLRN